MEKIVVRRFSNELCRLEGEIGSLDEQLPAAVLFQHFDLEPVMPGQAQALQDVYGCRTAVSLYQLGAVKDVDGLQLVEPLRLMHSLHLLRHKEPDAVYIIIQW